jgi:hypothetical protein
LPNGAREGDAGVPFDRVEVTHTLTHHRDAVGRVLRSDRTHATRDPATRRPGASPGYAISAALVVIPPGNGGGF